MAVLERIRNRAGLLVFIVFLALASFVLGDFLSSGRSFFGPGDEIGEINGKTISGREFMQRLKELEARYMENTGRPADENARDQMAQQLWNTYLSELLFEVEFKRAGLGVSAEELTDMVQGENISPDMLNIAIFKDSATQQFSRDKVIQFISTQLTEEADPEGRMRRNWAEFEQDLSKNRLRAKYNNLLKKAMYATDAATQRDIANRFNQAEFKLVAKKYDAIPDSTIQLTDSELRKFYESRSYEFEQKEETRRVDYVSFMIMPSAEDREALTEDMKSLIAPFAAAENDTQFIAQHSVEPINVSSFKRGTLNFSIDSAAFAGRKGDVLGPYFENNMVKLAKIVGLSSRSDSVRARHILFSTREGKYTSEVAKKKADSLKTVVQRGGNFAELAKTLSDDVGSGSKGGDLDWFTEGMMVKPFNDACFEGKPGDYVVVESDFGVHLIHIQQQTRRNPQVQLAFVSKKLEASPTTSDIIYAQASDFAGNAATYEIFKKEAEEKGYSILNAEGLKASDKRVNDISNGREIVSWLFNPKTKLNQVSRPFNLGDRYVIAVYSGVKNKGIPTFEQMKTTIEPLAKRAAKAERIIQEMNDALSASGNALDKAAEKLGLMVEPVSGVTFSAFSMPNHGYEPKAVGSVYGLKEGQVSKPVEGITGVYVLQLEKINKEGAEGKDLKQEKKQATDNLANRVESQVNNALMKKANVTDERWKFF